MIAGFMSINHGERTGSSPVKANEKLVRKIVETEVVHVINELSAISMHDVRDLIAQCPLSQKIVELIENGTETQDPDLEPYRRVLDELSVVRGVICKGRRIVIPDSLQKKVVKLCHRSHQGMSKTKPWLVVFVGFQEWI